MYRIDQEARQDQLSADDRLRLHQKHSEPAMKSLQEWLDQQVAEKLVEPNSGLAGAIGYLRRHWEKLQLTPAERSLLLKYGYPFSQSEAALKACAEN